MYIINKSIKIAKDIFPKIYKPSKNRNWHFAFAYKRNRLLSIGTNNMFCETSKIYKMSRRFNLKQEYMFAHAEQDVVSRMWGKYHIDEKIRIVILRLNKYYVLKESKPCPYCQSILDALCVNDLYWSTNSGEFFSKIHNKII